MHVTMWYCIWLTQMVLHGVEPLPVKLPTHKCQTHFWKLLYIKVTICQDEQMSSVYEQSAMWWVRNFNCVCVCACPCKCLDLTAH